MFKMSTICTDICLQSGHKWPRLESPIQQFFGTGAQQQLRWATVGHNRHGPKIGGCAPFSEEGAGCLSNTVAWAEAYLHTKWHPNPSSRLAPTDIGRKLGLCPFGGELGPHLTQCGKGRGLPACQVSSWSVQPFGYNAPTSQTARQNNGPIAQGEPFAVAQQVQRAACSTFQTCILNSH